jgi:hypothetical protein
LKTFFCLLFGILLATSASRAQNVILSSGNTKVTLTNYLGGSSVSTLTGLPLGTVDGTATGTLGLKVLVTGGSVTTVPATVTPTIIAVGASTTGTIPSGAKGWTITFLSGTGTFGGVAVTVGFSDSDPHILASNLVYVTGSASSAYVRFNQ